jgi:hypothetical protein
MPEALSDLARTAPTWTPETVASTRLTDGAVLLDRSTYGPATLAVPLGGDAPAATAGYTWGECLPIAPPPTPSPGP